MLLFQGKILMVYLIWQVILRNNYFNHNKVEGLEWIVVTIFKYSSNSCSILINEYKCRIV